MGEFTKDNYSSNLQNDRANGKQIANMSMSILSQEINEQSLRLETII